MLRAGGNKREVQPAERPRSRVCVAGFGEGFLPQEAPPDGAALRRAGAPAAPGAPGPGGRAGSAALGCAGLAAPGDQREGRKEADHSL